LSRSRWGGVYWGGVVLAFQETMIVETSGQEYLCALPKKTGEIYSKVNRHWRVFHAVTRFNPEKLWKIEPYFKQ